VIFVDTCGWIEWLADGRLAGTFEPYLEDNESLVVPTIVQFELYKWLERNSGEEAAMKAIARKHGADLVTSDDHFEGLAGVTYFAKKDR